MLLLDLMSEGRCPEQQIFIIPEPHRADTEEEWTQSVLINSKNAEKGSFRQTRKAFSMCDNCCRVNMSVTDGLSAYFVILTNSQTN